MTYSRPWKGVTVGGEVLAGRDVFGQSFSRVSGFVRYGGDQRTRDDGEAAEEDSVPGRRERTGAEIFVDVGVNANQVHINLRPGDPADHDVSGHRSALCARCPPRGLREQRFGRARRTRPGGRSLSVRCRAWSTIGIATAIRSHSACSSGVDRYKLATPAYSMYGGIGAQWRNFLPSGCPNGTWDWICATPRTSPAIMCSPTDPRGSRPDSFYKIESAVLYLSRRF